MTKDSNDDTAKSGINCWGCNYQQIAGDTFLGKCTWFSKHKREKDKDITSKVVDTGCKYFVPRGL